MNSIFRKFASRTADILGTGWAFVWAILFIFGWAISGPVFHYSDSWQLVINTATNLITFLMVFLIQNTQTRDTKATQVKLDELIRAIHGARNNLVSIEELSDEDLEVLRQQFQRLSRRYANAGPEEQQAVASIEEMDMEESLPPLDPSPD